MALLGWLGLAELAKVGGCGRVGLLGVDVGEASTSLYKALKVWVCEICWGLGWVRKGGVGVGRSQISWA